MNKLIYMLVIAGLLTSCNILKRQFKNKIEHSAVATLLTDHEQKNSLQEHKLLVIRDSLKEDFIVEIIPDGIFSYSINDGFKGAGLAIKMKGSRSAALQVMKKNESVSSSQYSEQTAAREQKKETADEREGFRLGINIYYLLFGLIGIGLLWLWWKYRTKGKN